MRTHFTFGDQDQKDNSSGSEPVHRILDSTKTRRPAQWNPGHPSKRQRLAFFGEGWELLFDVALISCCGHCTPEFPKILIAPKF
jgi:hypothetical protein